MFNVGASLLANSQRQMRRFGLTHRFREQARSHSVLRCVRKKGVIQYCPALANA